MFLIGNQTSVFEPNFIYGYRKCYIIIIVEDFGYCEKCDTIFQYNTIILRKDNSYT